MVGIIYMQDIRFCPYLERYTSLLVESGIAFDCIWWERWDQPPDTPLPQAVARAQSCHVFRRPSKMARNPLYKLGDFAAFSQFARRIIAQQNYDKLILLTAFPAIVLSDLLMKKYRGQFLLDIRDYSYEDLPPYRWLEAKVIDASALTIISSEGFLRFLPPGRSYVVADNFMDVDLENAKRSRFCKKPEDKPIVLSYIGFIRYFEENKKILDRLVDDDRFQLVYHGVGADYDKLLHYQEQLGSRADRLQITGYFDCRTEKGTLCEQADLINNYYPRTLRIQRDATTNKTYDGMIYRRPQLVAKGTYSQDLMERWQIGCALDLDEKDLADALYRYYRELDEETFNQAAGHALEQVLQRDTAYRGKIRQFLSD